MSLLSVGAGLFGGRLRPGRVRGLALVVLLGLGVLPASAAAETDASLASQLSNVDGSLGRMEKRLAKLDQNYSRRRGLIGADEAEDRYQEAVYSYLISDYATAAVSFYILVESQALDDAAKMGDSEWYLAECLFELGNYKTAEQAYRRVLDRGEKHPFFTDAVLRLLEIFAITRQDDLFTSLYDYYVASGRVAPTDRVKYTVAKAFYRQGRNGRARASFDQLSAESSYYARSRYFVGTILATQGDLDGAIQQFQLVVAAVPKTAADREVQELGQLALARLYYEKGDYVRSTETYQTITSRSKYFADQLYELVWTFIKQEMWEDALRNLDIFLIAYPDHPHAVRLKLIQGHLNMKEIQYDKALESYETLIIEYEPVRDTLRAVETDREALAHFFERIVNRDVFGADKEGLPSFALEYLAADVDISRAVALQSELGVQEQQVEEANVLIAEIEAGLRAGNGSIGTFNRGRSELAMVTSDGLYIKETLINLEFDYLLASVPSNIRPEVQALRARFDVLRSRSEEIRNQQSSSLDKKQAQEAQVREVQQQAARVQTVASDLQAQVSETRDELDQRSGMAAAEEASVRSELAAIDDTMSSIVEDMGLVQSANTKARIMQGGGSGPLDSTTSQSQMLASDYLAIHKQLSQFHPDVQTADRQQVVGELDRLWSRSLSIDKAAAATLAKVNTVEREELARVKHKLAEESTVVATLSSDIGQTEADSVDVAIAATSAGFVRLQGEFDYTILEADKGIVDVYWLRKSGLSDEITRMSEERAERLAELNARYGLVRQKLESETGGGNK